MDGPLLAKEMYLWLERRLDDFNLAVDDLSRDGNKVRLRFQDVTQIFVFEGDEGSKQNVGKPLSFSIYVPGGSQDLADVVEMRLSDIREGRSSEATHYSSYGDSRRDVRRIGDVRRISREYDKIFREPVVGVGDVEYEGQSYSGVYVRVPIRQIPRGGNDGLSDKLFSVARRELIGVVQEVVQKREST